MTLWEFLANLDNLTLILAGALFVIISIVIFYMARSGLVKIPWVPVRDKQADEMRDLREAMQKIIDSQNAPRETHEGCPLQHDFERMKKVSYKLGELKAETRKSQKATALRTVESIRVIAWGNYKDLLIKKGLIPPKLDIADQYSNVIQCIRDYAITLIETNLDENHFADMTPREFTRRFEMRYKENLEKITEMMQAIWPPELEEKIAYSEVWEWNKRIEPEVKSRLYELFMEFKQLAEEAQARWDRYVDQYGEIEREEI